MNLHPAPMASMGWPPFQIWSHHDLALRTSQTRGYCLTPLGSKSGEQNAWPGFELTFLTVFLTLTLLTSTYQSRGIRKYPFYTAWASGIKFLWQGTHITGPSNKNSHLKLPFIMLMGSETKLSPSVFDPPPPLNHGCSHCLPSCCY